MAAFRSTAIIRIAIVACLSLFIVHSLLVSQGRAGWLRPSWRKPTAPQRDEDNNPVVQDEECPNIPGLDKIVITVKTGASEAVERIPAQWASMLKCFPNVLFFSDMEQHLGQHHLHDSLADVHPDAKLGNPIFDLYRKQQDLASDDEISTPRNRTAFLAGLQEAFPSVKKAAWDLDRFKNIHIVEKAWALLPRYDWYLHIDADTFVFPSSLAAFVRKFRPEDKIYGGSMVCTGIGFAHGGSGILISRAAVESLVVEHKDVAREWDEKVLDYPYGDLVLARAFEKTGTMVRNAWPIFQGAGPYTVQYAGHHWCQPVATLHHVRVEDFEALARFERERDGRGAPITYSHLFTHLVRPLLHPSPKKGWNNHAKGTTIPSLPDAEACHTACEIDKSCFQSSFDGTDCFIGSESFTLGKVVEGDEEEREKWSSSWNLGRIDEWVRKEGCGRPEFRFRTDLACG